MPHIAISLVIYAACFVFPGSLLGLAAMLLVGGAIEEAARRIYRANGLPRAKFSPFAVSLCQGISFALADGAFATAKLYKSDQIAISCAAAIAIVAVAAAVLLLTIRGDLHQQPHAA